MEKELQLIIDNLDFSGNRASWFDNWSTEFDWDGEGNKTPQQRSKYLKLTLKFFNEAKLKLKRYPKEYQLWIEIVENDSAKDGIHIHTQNPNKTVFPLKLKTKKDLKVKDPVIAEFIQKSKLMAVEVVINDTKVIVAFDPHVGIPPVDL